MPWHALCIPVWASGCIILSGPWSIQTNSPPEIRLVEPQSRIITFDTAQRAIFVQARDPDEDNLVFTWILPTGAPRPEDVISFSTQGEDGTLWTSRLTLRRDDFTEGGVVDCLVVDGGSVGVPVRFTVEVP